MFFSQELVAVVTASDWFLRLAVEKEAMEAYATVTGDWDGVEIVTDENGKNVTRGRCWDDYFWYPPACRDTCHISLQVLGPETPKKSGHLRVNATCNNTWWCGSLGWQLILGSLFFWDITFTSHLDQKGQAFQVCDFLHWWKWLELGGNHAEGNCLEHAPGTGGGKDLGRLHASAIADR